jgi:hypothetical protein
LQREVEDDETCLLVVVARFGAVGDRGLTARNWRWCTVVVSSAIFLERKKEKGKWRGDKNEGWRGPGEKQMEMGITLVAWASRWERHRAAFLCLGVRSVRGKGKERGGDRVQRRRGTPGWLGCSQATGLG